MSIEYTWNELENENLRFTHNGIRLLSASGPEPAGDGLFCNHAFDDDGNPYDLTWRRSGLGGDEFFVLIDVKPADIAGDVA